MNKAIERERVKAFVEEIADLFTRRRPPPLAVVELRALLRALYGDANGRMTAGRWADMESVTKRNGLKYLWNASTETVVFLPEAPINEDDEAIESVFERFFEQMGTGR